MKQSPRPRAQRSATDVALSRALANMQRRLASADPWALARARATRTKGGAR